MNNPANSMPTIDYGGKLGANILQFARLLRQLNIPVSTQQVQGALQGLDLVDISSELDFYNTLRTFFLHDISKKQQFDLAFDLYWSNYMKMILEIPGPRAKFYQQSLTSGENTGLSQIAGSILQEIPGESLALPEKPSDSDIHVQPFYSSNEVFRIKDFSQYSAEDFHRAKKIIDKSDWTFAEKSTRRRIRKKKRSKYLDFLGSIRRNINSGGELIRLDWLENKKKSRGIVVLCDVSGSMEKYSRIFLHFLYSMVQKSERVETFVFGTRLTRLTSLLHRKNPDQVIQYLSSITVDWSGGTRIGDSIKDFNYCWARRVRCQGSIVMIISDGWDRGNLDLLEKEIRRLSRTSHRLIWLNPLAGSTDYQPVVQGIQTIMPHVDDFYPLANLNNLESFAKILVSLQ
jgi:uncharacterized protein with von Willebrand factor type A (vWA) domain